MLLIVCSLARYKVVAEILALSICVHVCYRAETSRLKLILCTMKRSFLVKEDLDSKKFKLLSNVLKKEDLNAIRGGEDPPNPPLPPPPPPPPIG